MFFFKKIFTLLFLIIVRNHCISQDTIPFITDKGVNIAIVGELNIQPPPAPYYIISPKKDSIFYKKYIGNDLMLMITYIKSQIEGLWIAFYKNKSIMQMGYFMKPAHCGKYCLTVLKIGLWYYFTEDGKIERTEYYNKKGESLNNIILIDPKKNHKW